jgi:SHS2 domain-containing protein
VHASHRWNEDTGELRLEVHGPSEQAVFRQTFAAVRELFAGGEPSAGQRVQRHVEAEADDHRALLADWVSELVVLVEHERLMLDAVEGVRVLDGQLEATVRARTGDPPHRVKGVVYHDVELRRDRAGWRASVVLDA